MPLLTIFTGIRVDLHSEEVPLEMSLAAYGQTNAYITAVTSANNIKDTYSKLINNVGSNSYLTDSYIASSKCIHTCM